MQSMRMKARNKWNMSPFFRRPERIKGKSMFYKRKDIIYLKITNNFANKDEFFLQRIHISVIYS